MMGILIRRPVQDVFDYVMSIEETPSWRPRMSEVRWTSEPPVGIGSTFEVVVRALGMTVRFTPEIVHWEPPRAVTYRQSTGPAQMESFLEWHPEGESCRFSMGAKPGARGWMRHLAPVVGRSILYQNSRDLERLKAILEDQA